MYPEITKRHLSHDKVMNREYLVREVHIGNDDIDNPIWHYFPGLNYISIVSLNSFFFTYRCQESNKILYVLKRKDDFLFPMAYESRPWEEVIGAPGTKKHRSIWDFYKYIGYDWKRKKYVSTNGK